MFRVRPWTILSHREEPLYKSLARHRSTAIGGGSSQICQGLFPLISERGTFSLPSQFFRFQLSISVCKPEMASVRESTCCALSPRTIPPETLKLLAPGVNKICYETMCLHQSNPLLLLEASTPLNSDES